MKLTDEIASRGGVANLAVYYNEIDAFAAQWLRRLIAAGVIAYGDVDERSIIDVSPDDLRGYTQCHFFAGIGVWSYALRQAGWSDDYPVWTGSCPCQPFSTAGKGAGFADERHLWPAFHHLIRECRPATVFGEQVASPDGLHWIDLVQSDLEGEGYAVGAADLCAAGVGAPHIRQRLYWVAERVAYPGGTGLEGRWKRECERSFELAVRSRGVDGRMAYAESERWHGCENSPWEAGRDCIEDSRDIDRPGPTNGYWRNADWLGCRDGKWRPVEPGTFPLVDGATARVGRLRGYGNAIVAPLAAEFIRACMDVGVYQNETSR